MCNTVENLHCGHPIRSEVSARESSEKIRQKPIIQRIYPSSKRPKMQETLGPLLLISWLTLVAANRVYVHPFSLFAYDNFSCEIIQAQAQKPLAMVKPIPIDPQDLTEPPTHTHKDVEGSREKVTQEVTVLAELQNTLGLRFYNALMQQKPANALFSPVNAFGALVVLYMGASNTTAEHLQHLLGLGDNGEMKDCVPLFDGHKVLHAQWNISSLVDANTDELRTLVWNFVNNGVDLSQEFVRGMQDFSDASYVRSVDFSKSEEAEAQMNSFIQRASAGNMKHLFKAISPSTEFLFASAILFKGKWRTAIKSEVMTLQKFWTSEETSVMVPFMSHTGSYKYLNDKGGRCTIIQLPLSKGTYMLLVLPHEGTSLEHIEAKLNTNLISKWKKHLNEGFLEVSLPKLSVSFVSDLKDILSNMKLSYLLGEQADFGRLSSKENLTLDKVLNNVVFEISEEGAKDQTAPEDGSVAPKFTINRPFFFTVVEGNSDAILLLGRITNPTQ